MGAVKFVILQRINDVKTNKPANHRQTKQYGLNANRPTHCQPCANWCQAQSNSKIYMSKIGEALRERIKADHENCDRRKHKADPVDVVTHGNQACTRQQTQRPGAHQRNSARRKMSRRCSRIFGIEMTVNNAVKGHCASARANHGSDNEKKNSEARPAMLWPGRDHHRAERERKRENRMRQFYEFRLAAHAFDRFHFVLHEEEPTGKISKAIPK